MDPLCVDDVLTSPAGSMNAFVATRPPGHHASSAKSSGFCIFNNVAIGAKYAQQKYNVKKILVLDWDVHHGNGTQEIFYEDDSVLYMSIHRHERGEFYPMGEPKDYFDTGEEIGKGFSVNVPFSGHAMGDFEYLSVFLKAIMPIAYEFNPELLSPEAFASMTHQLCSLASGRVIAILEGGYNLTALSKSALAVCEVLKYQTMVRRLKAETEEQKIKLRPECIKVLQKVCWEQAKYWKILRGFNTIIGTVSNSKLINKSGKPSSSARSSAARAMSKQCLTPSAPPTRRSPRLVDPSRENCDESMSGPSSSKDMTPVGEVNGLYAVTPASHCPHLDQVRELPSTGIDASMVCEGCGIKAEVWVCLHCYKGNCGRFINEHALIHSVTEAHPMALSLADLSVWCYPCNTYVHNPVLIPAKSSVHQSKFGEPMPH
ncbi:unnamed protein product [Caenorhabditis bovis]|uniref:UBP-type domain-containing protein n=1 Tax=Caenorhabditis bovis TaxID=2654633 RepID=A0A8S1EWY9_9PELO|nr:unnamed protein product [Caenorhabditis bovis]